MDRRNFLKNGIYSSAAFATLTASMSYAESTEPAVIVNVRDFGATGDGVTNDLAACQAAVDAVCARERIDAQGQIGNRENNLGGIILFPDGEYNFHGGTLYVRDVGTRAGEGVDGINIQGASNGGTRILNGVVSIGNRSVNNNDQTGSVGKASSNSISVKDIAIIGALELFSCQRASVIQNVRIVPRIRYQGLLVKYCNALMLHGVRVDNGGSSRNGIVINKSPNLTIIGGGANYNNMGIRFITGDGPSTSPRLIGFHLEGNRGIHLDLWGVKNADIQVHVVVASTYFNAGGNKPLVRVRNSKNIVFRNTYIYGHYNGNIAPVGIDIRSCNLTVVQNSMIDYLEVPVRAPSDATKNHHEQFNLINENHDG